MDELASALEVAAAIRSREVSPLEVLDACLVRVDDRNPALNAVIWRNDEEARAKAIVVGERIASGATDVPPFAGVPLPIKDLVPVAGQPLTYGSLGVSDQPSAETEPIVEAFIAAGFILTGRTNTPAFGAIRGIRDTPLVGRAGVPPRRWHRACFR
jgi:amidase